MTGRREVNTIDAKYFSAMLPPLVEGRGFTGADRREIAAMDRSLPVLSVETLESRLAQSTADRRYRRPDYPARGG